MTIEEIQEVLTLLKLNGEVRSQNVQIPCPFAAVSGHRSIVDSHPSLGLRPTDDGAMWNCFACGRRGKIERFIDLLEAELGYVVEDARKKLIGLLTKSPEELASSIPAYGDHYAPNPRKTPTTFPSNWMAPYAGKVPKYILDRGVTLESCKRFRIGFDKQQSRVLFPVYDADDSLVGAVGGLTVKAKTRYQPKYKNYWHRVHSTCGWPLDHRDGKFRCGSCQRRVSVGEVKDGFRKSNFLYGEWLLPKEPAVLILVEGIIDSISVWQAIQGRKKFEKYFPMALFGSEVSVEQANKIVRYTAERKALIWMDNDVAGRAGDKKMKEFIARRVRYFRPQYPEKTEGFDPGKMNPAQIREAILSAKVVL